jgi:hypothetical protein
MDSTLCDLEMRCIDSMSRQQLLEAIRRRQDSLPADLRERLEEQTDGWLRLLLMLARLTYALRQLQEQYRADVAPRG